MKKNETTDARSAVMRAVKSENTTPELMVRRMLHAAGYRFRIHRKDLPGKPDLVFPARRKAIFVNGCFWHGHQCKRGCREPKTNEEYWRTKIARNISRDLQSYERLRELGWQPYTIWECELSAKTANESLIKAQAFLDQP